MNAGPGTAADRTVIGVDPRQTELHELSRPRAGTGPCSFAELRVLIRSDLFRYAGNTGPRAWLVHGLFTPGFKYTSWMRLCGLLRSRPVLRRVAFPPAKLVLLHYRYKYGIAIPEYTRVGAGLYIARFGGVMVNGDAVIGRNCNISHGVTLGQINRGGHLGSPVLGDRVYLGAGAKVLGAVRLGDDVAVGANAVVTKDAPAGSVLVGVPARVVATTGSAGYVNRTV